MDIDAMTIVGHFKIKTLSRLYRNCISSIKCKRLIFDDIFLQKRDYTRKEQKV